MIARSARNRRNSPIARKLFEFVLRACYVQSMSATTTIRLSEEDRRLLARLVPDFGDQSSAIRHGIRLLAEEQERRETLRALLHDWEAEAGPVDEDAVAVMTQRYFDR